MPPMSRLSRRRQRTVLAVSAAVAAALAIAAAVLSWPQLLARYRLAELRREPARLVEFLLAEEPASDAAARAFLRERTGKEQLFRAYLEEYDLTKVQWSVHDQLLRIRDQGHTAGFIGLWENGYMSHMRKGKSGGNFGSISSLEPLDPRRRSIILELLDASCGEVFTHPKFARFEFQVAKVAGGKVEQPVWPGEEGAPALMPSRERARHVCFFRILPE